MSTSLFLKQHPRLWFEYTRANHEIRKPGNSAFHNQNLILIFSSLSRASRRQSNDLLFQQVIS